MDKVKKYDLLTPLSSEFRVKTATGGFLTLVCLLTVVYLTVLELRLTWMTIPETTFVVNSTSLHPIIPISFDVSFRSIPCNLLSIGSHDLNGQEQTLHLDRKHHIYKRRLNEKGFPVGGRKKEKLGGTLTSENEVKEYLGIEDAPDNTDANANANADKTQKKDPADSSTTPAPTPTLCGDCYGAGEDGECCDSCDDVRRAYRRKGWTLRNNNEIAQCKEEAKVAPGSMKGEGCNIYGNIEVQAAGGDLHVSGGKGLYDLEGGVDLARILDSAYESFNVSHTINKLRFGTNYPGAIQQLDSESRTVLDGRGMYQYYFTIVPTTYVPVKGPEIVTYQYSVTEHLRHLDAGSNRGTPGVWFYYDVSAVSVRVEEKRKGWTSFFTSLAAVVGGVVTFFKFVDLRIYEAGKRRFGSDRLGS
ncbi:hypothetical protein TL16_g00276, partial [Triparma laevis f. inornata]|uniref:Endoplasmic reticulum-Golgi intermediate compartment protein 3 n=2 Tax=Triparma laevis TaxID=1534972 RepID=A0A9W7KZI8_9STRA